MAAHQHSIHPLLVGTAYKLEKLRPAVVLVWNETYAKTHFVTAVVICFSGNAKTTRGNSL